jgi:hypothetical protein
MYALLPNLPGKKRGREAGGTSLEHQGSAIQAGQVVAEVKLNEEHSKRTFPELSSAVHEVRDIPGAFLEHSPPAKRRKSNRLAEFDQGVKSP